jgi:hypothetical protein
MALDMSGEDWSAILEGAVFLLLLVWMLLDRFQIYFRHPPEE